MNRKLTFISLFSGYDSQCLALDRLKQKVPGFDYELLAWCEIEPNAIKAHNILYPQWKDRNLGDISKCNWGGYNELRNVDLVSYSFPCQDISNAGLQRGFGKGSGTRSGLLWECEKAFEKLRPKMLIMENVKALVQKTFMPEFKKWIEALSAMGYTSYWQVMNAKDYGVPHSRERVFMVSIHDSIGNLGYNFPKPFPLVRRLKDVLEQGVSAEYYMTPEQVQRIITHCERKKAEGCNFHTNFKGEDDISTTITTKYGQRETDTYIAEGVEEKFIGMSIHPLNRQMEFQGYKSIKTDYSPTLTAHDGRGGEPCVWYEVDTPLVQPLVPWNRPGQPSDICPTITTSAFEHNNVVIEPCKPKGLRLRKFTEREAFRLMDVDDERIDTLLNATETINLKSGKQKTRSAISKTVCYTLAGNSIVVANLYYIIYELLKNYHKSIGISFSEESRSLRL